MRTADLLSLLPPLRRLGTSSTRAVCWANSATNAAVLRDLGDKALAYTPHLQPDWTIETTPEALAFIDDVHHRMARRADAVLCDSPRERALVQAQTHGRNNCHHVPLGVDTAAFRPGPTHRPPQLLFVGDLAEPRKRFDRVLAILPRLLASRPDLKLIVVGNGSDLALDQIPPDLRPSCELRGYVPEPELRRTYAESQGVFLLSDYEAFDSQILGLLACGTPVFLTDLDVTRSLFDTYRGAKFCPADDPEATFAVVDRTCPLGETRSSRPCPTALASEPTSTGMSWPSGSGSSSPPPGSPATTSTAFRGRKSSPQSAIAARASWSKINRLRAGRSRRSPAYGDDPFHNRFRHSPVARPPILAISRNPA